jgi:hypothetical protein
VTLCNSLTGLDIGGLGTSASKARAAAKLWDKRAAAAAAAGPERDSEDDGSASDPDSDDSDSANVAEDEDEDEDSDDGGGGGGGMMMGAQAPRGFDIADNAHLLQDQRSGFSSDSATVSSWFDAVEAGNSSRVSTLLDGGVDVNVVSTESGMTALHWAADRGDLGMVETLCRRGADPNRQDEDAGMTALHYALECDHADVVTYLMDKTFADVTIADEDGTTCSDLLKKREGKKNK